MPARPSTAGQGNGTRDLGNEPDQETLSTLADQLLDSTTLALSVESGRRPLALDVEAAEDDDLVYELALRLCALYRIDHREETQSKDASDNIAGELERARLSGKLNDEALIILDKIQTRILQLGHSVEHRDENYIPTPAEHMGTAYGRKGYLDEVLRRQWLVDTYGGQVTVVDLMLPPYTTLTSQSLVGHPIVKLAVDRAWSKPLKPSSPRQGAIRLLDESGMEDRSGLSTLHGPLQKFYTVITPRRQQFLHCVSFLVLYSLTAILAIHPRSLIVPYTLTQPHPKAIEVVYIIWAATFVLESLWRRSAGRMALAIPTFLCLNAISKPPAAYSFLCLSIPTLTVLLVLPSAPSLVYVSPKQSLPLATILYSALGRAIASLSLMGPVVLLVFALFAAAMNGETRLFTMDGLVASYQRLMGMEIVTEMEGRVAPYEARLSIFIALSILLVLSIPLAISQSYPPVHPTRSSESSTQSGQPSVRLGEDDWDNDYAPYIALRARQHWSSTVNHYLHPRAMVPLNVLVLPLDLIAALVMIRPIPLRRAIAIRRTILRWRDALVVILMAPFCAALGVLEYFAGSLEPRRRSR